jgi:4-diphosphocytidyl-2-C-methyl-D-erythritol kinase
MQTTDRELSLPAPGKLNLMLRIIGRRPDGYHLLQTVFQFIDRYDWLRFRSRSDGAVDLTSVLPGVPAEQNLVVRAAKLLQTYAEEGNGVDIEVQKNLPMGGGLGGGSSDAATTLLALNRLWGIDLPREVLMDLGLTLGADVPIFIHGQSAWAEGVGEKLTPVDLPEPWYVVVVPPCHVPTAKVFSSERLTRNNKPIKISNFLEGMQANDCLPVVSAIYPEIRSAISDLASRGVHARLTGTGACLFAACDTKAQADGVAGSLQDKWSAFVAKGMNRSLLHQALGQSGFRSR